AFARTLLPGTSADVEVILRTAANVPRIPSYALLEGDRVLIFDRGRLEARKVTTGLRNWEYAEIAAGLAEGDRVVVSLDNAEVKEGVRALLKGELGGPREEHAPVGGRPAAHRRAGGGAGLRG